MTQEPQRAGWSRSADLLAQALVVGAVVLCLAASPAAAHPHVFVTTAVAFSVLDGKVIGFKEYWFFDDLYSSGFLSEFDGNSNSALDADEVENIRNGPFVGLKDYGYFTVLTVGGQTIDIKAATDFNATIVNGLLIYEFYVQFEHPVDAAANPITVSIYDKEYYIEMLPSESNPAAIEGDDAGRCRFEVSEDTDNPFYFASVFPQMVTLTCE